VTIAEADICWRKTGSVTTAIPPAAMEATDITAARRPACVAMKNGRNANRPNAR
jgi:hypothetical protein